MIQAVLLVLLLAVPLEATGYASAQRAAARNYVIIKSNREREALQDRYWDERGERAGWRAYERRHGRP